MRLATKLAKYERRPSQNMERIESISNHFAHAVKNLCEKSPRGSTCPCRNRSRIFVFPRKERTGWRDHDGLFPQARPHTCLLPSQARRRRTSGCLKATASIRVSFAGFIL